MEVEGMGAQIVMSDETWKFAIDYVDEVHKVDKHKASSTSEAVSNGIWYEILRRNFRFPKFIIAPEQRQTTGKRPDFTIFFVDNTNKEWHPVFTFEGKAPYHINVGSKIEKGKAQAAGYVPSLSWSNDEEINKGKKITYGMFACGKSFMILAYDVDTETICETKYSSLNTDAEWFDDFCKKRADSF
ncbi:hypothetical protein F52700_542 [Fusarium sp. NRRL 52700]|nr:hypothetical protein F52700_542 [Fusarium sp. NRRL 52700]